MTFESHGTSEVASFAVVPHMVFCPCSESSLPASPCTAVPRVRGAHKHFPPAPALSPVLSRGLWLSVHCSRRPLWPLVCVWLTFPRGAPDLGVEVCEGVGGSGGSG